MFDVSKLSFGPLDGLISFVLQHYIICVLILYGTVVPAILIALNQTWNYFFKMTIYYLTILATAAISSVACIPLYFFGDPAKFVYNTLNVLGSWTGIKCEIRGEELLHKELPFVLIVNHQSSLDMKVLSEFWPKQCTVMMKRSLLYVPFFGFVAFLCRSIFVDRFNHKKAHESLLKSAELIRDKRLSLVVFPEGTRNHAGGMLPFKKGAFNIAVQAGIPIIPCVISSYNHFYSKEKRYFYIPGRVVVQILDPISTDKLTLDDVPALSEQVRTEMVKTYERISKEAAELQKQMGPLKKFE